jgi:hypothetical protein
MGLFANAFAMRLCSPGPRSATALALENRAQGKGLDLLPALYPAGMLSPGWMTPHDVPNIRAFGPSPYSTAAGVTNSDTSRLPQGSIRSTGEREVDHTMYLLI